MVSSPLHRLPQQAKYRPRRHTAEMVGGKAANSYDHLGCACIASTGCFAIDPFYLTCVQILRSI